MKKRIIILVEGQTEEEFIKKTLAPYLQNFNIFNVRAIRFATSSVQKGGMVNYSKFKNTVVRFLNQENDILVTSLIDFFRLPNSFPAFSDAQKLSNSFQKVIFLENQIDLDINDNRFFAYIQLHEMEALLFSKIDGFEKNGISGQFLFEINQIIQQYPNPEQINDHPNTAPSKRLEKIISGYKKVVYGNIIIETNGIESILEKCPRFSDWVKKIIEQA
jgi:Domain of unknown function (DUF4276)